MHIKKIFTHFSLIFLFSITLNADPFKEVIKHINGSHYIFCVDGGGSNTQLKVLDKDGQQQVLHHSQNPKSCYQIEMGSSNINVVDQNKIKEDFQNLLNNLYIGESLLPVKSIIKNSAFIGGFAGAGADEPKKQMVEIIKSLGFPAKRVGVFTDAGLALELTGEKGAILIAGTGSICFVQDGEKLHRVGGLGYRMSDEGSGYYLSLKGIKAAIESEYDPRDATSLTAPIKDFFGVQKARDLIQPIQKNLISSTEVAKLSYIVFDEAQKKDPVALELVKDSADQLAELLVKGIKKSQLKHCKTYLIGGLFQSNCSEEFIDQISSSKAFTSLSDEQKPLLINISKCMIPSIVVKEALRYKSDKNYKAIIGLPVVDQSSCGEFKKKFSMGFITTEKSNPDAENLSQVFQQSSLEGLQLLHKLDDSVLHGTEKYIDQHLEPLYQDLIEKVKNGGRICFIGSGSSGRIACDLAAKWNKAISEKEHLKKYKESVCGIIAGGPRAFVKAREGFEDSDELGMQALQEINFKSEDVAILISASGSANFNVGAAKYAHEKKGSCYYFYNSEKVPLRTQSLFDNKLAQPILVDIGPQSITGSTRLQAASLAELCMGLTLEEVLCNLNSKQKLNIKEKGLETLDQVKTAYNKVYNHLDECAKIIDLELEVFLNPQANFWKTFDESNQGFITFLANQDSLREVMVDTTETAPTFSTNPPRDISHDLGRKRAEYRAFLITSNSNQDAWEELIERPLKKQEFLQVSDLLVSSSAQGYGSFNLRVEEKNNLLIGVFKSSQKAEDTFKLLKELKNAKDRGLKTALIVLEEEGSPLCCDLNEIQSVSHTSMILKDLPKDSFGLASTLALKQTLNLISNATMIKMNKVYGNTMIDVSPTNNKLIDRTIRIIQQIHAKHHPSEKPFSYELLFQYVTRASLYKKLMDQQLHTHVPSCTKLVLTMLEKKCSPEKATEFLKNNHENVHEIFH